MSQKLYDIQGTPIKVGSLVAYCTALGGHMWTARVKATGAFEGNDAVLLAGGNQRLACDVVVLEEPVWPNS